MKQKCEKPLSNFAFNCNLRPYILVRKLLVRARLQPLLAVLSSWKSTPDTMTAGPDSNPLFSLT